MFILAFFGFRKGGAPGENLPDEDGPVNKLWITTLMVVSLVLAPGPPAPAQTAVEYGGIASKNQGGGELGNSVNHKFKSARTKGSSHTPKKAKR
jgi:hypothetical protein